MLFFQSESGLPIYCSPQTAAVLPTLLAEGNENFLLNRSRLRPLRLNVPYHFDEFTVTLLDSNYVPGAVMFIFESSRIPGSPVLYTGYFRADSSFYMKVNTVSLLKKVFFYVRLNFMS